MTPSIKMRLLLWVIGGTAGLLAVFAFVVYGVMYRSLVNGFDAVLASTARTIASSVEQNEEKIKAEIDERELPEFHRAKRPDFFQLWREDGSILARSTSLKEADLELFGALLNPVFRAVRRKELSRGKSAIRGALLNPVFRAVRLPDGRAGRAIGIVFVPKVDEEAKGPAQPQKVTLVLARETAALNSDISFLRWLLTGATGGTIILALLVGTMIVRQGLKPLDALATRIAAIRQDDLSTRIPVDRMPAEVAPVAQRLNELLRRLEEAFRRERSFTADVAHELRTPLAGIRSTLEVTLTRPRVGGEYQQAMEECLDIVRHTQAMVNNLLALAHLEGGQTILHPDALPLGEMVDSTWRPFADSVRARGITVESQVPADLTCIADRNTLLMILTNVFANAEQYTNDGGRITVTARRAGESVDLMVENTGSQLSEEDARHVFERFWRGDLSRTDTGSHFGLGLALVQRAVTSLGGTVAARVDDGTFMVQLSLPAAPAS
jgi:two-component system sensor histidine kinase QseC